MPPELSERRAPELRAEADGEIPKQRQPNVGPGASELHVGTQVDYYEMLEIAPVSMRLASLIVGANLTAKAEGKLVYKLNQPGPLPATIGIVNVTIAATEVTELRLLKT